MKHSFNQTSVLTFGIVVLMTTAHVFAASALPAAETHLAPSEQRVLAPRELQEDFSFLMKTVEEIHPNLYFKVPKGELVERRRKLESQLTHDLSTGAFFDLLHPFLESFADRHTQIWAPPEHVSTAPKSVWPSYKWKFEILSGKIGYLDFVRMEMSDREEWQRFLKETFQTLRDRKIERLIVDLRKNGGGSSLLGEDLLDYVTDKPYRTSSRKIWRFSPRYMSSAGFDAFIAAISSPEAKSYYSSAPTAEQKEFFAQNPSPEFKEILLTRLPEWQKAYHAKYAPHWLNPQYSPETATESLTWRFPVKDPVKPYPLRFAGRTCFLVGKETFSSAIMLGNAVQDFHLATIIGEETPPCNEFGEVDYFQLPHSHLNGMVPSSQVVRANGDAQDPHGILPDITVQPSPEDQARGADATIEAAKHWANLGLSRD